MEIQTALLAYVDLDTLIQLVLMEKLWVTLILHCLRVALTKARIVVQNALHAILQKQSALDPSMEVHFSPLQAFGDATALLPGYMNAFHRHGAWVLDSTAASTHLRTALRRTAAQTTGEVFYVVNVNMDIVAGDVTIVR